MAPLAGPSQLQKALLQAVRQFMNQSQVFTDRLELHLQSGVSEYLVDPPKCQTIVSIKGVFVNGEPTSYWARDGHEDVVCFYDDMTDCDCAVVEYAWAVKREDCEIPDKIWDDADYWWTVQNGALRIMHRMFGSTIVSQQRALDADEEWRNGVGNAKGRRVMNFSNSRPRMHRSRNRGRGFRWP
jgi:hypothetical protein